MYIDRVRLRDVKCFSDVTLRFQSAAVTGDRQSNWNVILGENGDGKTSLLQAIAACLMDATTADRLLKPTHWVRRGAKLAALEATLVPQDDDRSVPGRPLKNAPKDRVIGYRILGAGEGPKERFFSTATIVEPTPESRDLFGDDYDDRLIGDLAFLKRAAFSRREQCGWLSVGYGPYRRLPGAFDKLPDDTVEMRFATLFEEGAAIFDCERWLKELDRAALRGGKNGAAAKKTLADVKSILTRLLPDLAEIHLDEEIGFAWRDGTIGLGQLSHGYRSMFALTVDILRWLVRSRWNLDIPLNELCGVVLIDEVDAHLHPKWQREVGFLLCETFPKLQFIVTSHSPFVAMAAGEHALTVLDWDDEAVSPKQHLPYVRGWAADQVLAQLFGLVSLRDPETAAKLLRFEDLRLKKRLGPLSAKLSRELVTLDAYLEERLRGEPESPKNLRLEETLAFFEQQSKARQGASRA
jgi:energy-coupling factor transporter ATP-binding protein EcfA2